jgi:hypothetical protein
MMPSGHQFREARREPPSGQIAGAEAPGGSAPAAHPGMRAMAQEEARTRAQPPGKHPSVAVTRGRPHYPCQSTQLRLREIAPWARSRRS